MLKNIINYTKYSQIDYFASQIRGAQDCLVEAVACINGLGNNGCYPDEITYNTLIIGFSKLGDLKGVLCILGNMIKGQCKPNVVTSSVLINMYCNRGDTERAELIFFLSKNKDQSPVVY